MENFFESGPADDPLTYPGRIPTFSYVLLPRKQMAKVTPRKGRRLGQASVDATHLDERLGPSETSLNYILMKENAAPMDERLPVIAVGSNAAPAQLARKFSAGGVSEVVPALRCRVRGLRVAPSAHVNGLGYVPAAPASAPTGVWARV